jgi:predicted nucleic acid-binding protein
MTPTKAKDGTSNVIDGESAIEDALASTGASKLQKEIADANVDSLRTRAEQMLWIGADRRAAGRTSRTERSATSAGRGCHRRDSMICAGARSPGVTGVTTTTATSKRARSHRRRRRSRR